MLPELIAREQPPLAIARPSVLCTRRDIQAWTTGRLLSLGGGFPRAVEQGSEQGKCRPDERGCWGHHSPQHRAPARESPAQLLTDRSHTWRGRQEGGREHGDVEMQRDVTTAASHLGSTGGGLISIDGDEFVIHAMPMRPKYRKLLEP